MGLAVMEEGMRGVGCVVVDMGGRDCSGDDLGLYKGGEMLNELDVRENACVEM